jgi:hypothetical protein
MLEFKVPMAVNMKATVISNVTPYRLYKVTNILEEPAAFTLKMVATCSSETLVIFHWTIHHHIQEDAKLQVLKVVVYRLCLVA